MLYAKNDLMFLNASTGSFSGKNSKESKGKSPDTNIITYPKIARTSIALAKFLMPLSLAKMAQRRIAMSPIIGTNKRIISPM